MRANVKFSFSGASWWAWVFAGVLVILLFSCGDAEAQDGTCPRFFGGPVPSQVGHGLNARTGPGRAVARPTYMGSQGQRLQRVAGPQKRRPSGAPPVSRNGLASRQADNTWACRSGPLTLDNGRLIRR